MSYLRAQYQPPDPMYPADAPKQVWAWDDIGLQHALTEDSLVGDWLEYLANGGVIEPAIIPPISTEQIDVERDTRINSGFVFNEVLFQSRPFDRNNIAGATQAATLAVMNGAQQGDLRWADPDNDFVWIAADNTLYPMDAQTMIAYGQTLMAHQQAHIFAARGLKDTDPIPDDYTDNKYWP